LFFFLQLNGFVLRVCLFSSLKRTIAVSTCVLQPNHSPSG